MKQPVGRCAFKHLSYLAGLLGFLDGSEKREFVMEGALFLQKLIIHACITSIFIRYFWFFIQIGILVPGMSTFSCRIGQR